MKENIVIWDAENVFHNRVTTIEFANNLYNRFDSNITRFYVVLKRGNSSQNIERIGELGFLVVYVAEGDDTDQKIYDICIDEISGSNDIRQFTIVTGDKDFVRLVMTLQARNIRVEIISKDEHTSSQKLIETADLHTYSTDWIKPRFNRL